MSDVKLRPCPFCNDDAPAPTSSRHALQTYWVECDQCGAEGPYKLNENDAAAAWNTRPVEDARKVDLEKMHTLRPIDDYREDMGPVLWWLVPIEEPPYAGSPLDFDWPDYHTHFSPLPAALHLTLAKGIQTDDR